MDSASDFGSGGCGFKSHPGRYFYFSTKITDFYHIHVCNLSFDFLCIIKTRHYFVTTMQHATRLFLTEFSLKLMLSVICALFYSNI